MNWVLVAVFGALGAPTRYLTDRFIQNHTEGAFPWGTFTVNIAGAFLLGLLTGLGLHHQLSPDVALALGTGFCGALTTWSTWNFESVRLLEDGALLECLTNALGSLLVGLLAGAAGLGLALL